MNDKVYVLVAHAYIVCYHIKYALVNLAKIFICTRNLLNSTRSMSNNAYNNDYDLRNGNILQVAEEYEHQDNLGMVIKLWY